MPVGPEERPPRGNCLVGLCNVPEPQGLIATVSNVFLEPVETKPMANFPYVGANQGSYEQIRTYKFVGDGEGSYEQVQVGGYPDEGQSCRRVCGWCFLCGCFGFLVLAALLTCSLWLRREDDSDFLQGLFRDPGGWLQWPRRGRGRGSVVDAGYTTVGSSKAKHESTRGSLSSEVSRHELVRGCSTATGEAHAWYGQPRFEVDTEAAGEVVCCDQHGRSVREVHRKCISGEVNEHEAAPSKLSTFSEAVALCNASDLDLCSSSKEIDLSCSDVCGYDLALVWTKRKAEARHEWDCDADFAAWEKDWSRAKKVWCCLQKHRGCPSITTSEPFACRDADHRSSWTMNQKAWCCEHKDVGCPTTPFPEGAPDAGAHSSCHEHGHSAKGWTQARKDWCCAHQGTGCPTAATSRQSEGGLRYFDCIAGYHQWQKGWSEKKQAWCCQQYARGCSSVVRLHRSCTPTSGNEVLHWPTEKREACCVGLGRGCEAQSTEKTSGGTETPTWWASNFGSFKSAYMAGLQELQDFFLR